MGFYSNDYFVMLGLSLGIVVRDCQKIFGKVAIVKSLFRIVALLSVKSIVPIFKNDVSSVELKVMKYCSPWFPNFVKSRYTKFLDSILRNWTLKTPGWPQFWGKVRIFDLDQLFSAYHIFFCPNLNSTYSQLSLGILHFCSSKNENFGFLFSKIDIAKLCHFRGV